MAEQKVCVVGLGYAGLTLAVSLAGKGFKVWGYDKDAEKVEAINHFHSPFFEPGVSELLQKHLKHRLKVSAIFEQLPYDVIIIAVSTPVDPETHRPITTYLQEAVREVAQGLLGEPLVIIRSTASVGTTENLLLPLLRKHKPRLPVAYAPERTIQGQALHELAELPQVIGGVDEKSLQQAQTFFAKIAKQIVSVSSARVAELVKLINNAHTDVIYSFGNEVAMLAEALRIDPAEAIKAANMNYPRPQLHMPGFVGGSCMTKDPYLLLASASNGYGTLLTAARKLNESLAAYTIKKILSSLQQAGVSIPGAKAVVLGIAYKGTPATDDLRGAQSIEIIAGLRQAGMHVYGHDPLVPASYISALGAESIEYPEQVNDIDAIAFLTDHPVYKKLNLTKLLEKMKRPAVLFDAWRLFPRSVVESAGVTYQSIGV